MFVDASVIVAILTLERDADLLLKRLETTTAAFTSPLAVFEAVVAVARKGRLEMGRAGDIVQAFLVRSAIETRAIGSDVGYGAVDAHARYGKGRGHPAQLNMGDCFAYAMAKQHGVPLLYKGDDFARTDLA